MLVGVKDPIRLLRRIAVSVVGTVILVVGVVLLVAPGPGLVVIALALAVFAIEYQWARRNLAAVQARARSAALKAAASRVATASAVLFGVGAIGLGGVLVLTDLLPLSGVGTGVGVAVGGLTMPAIRGEYLKVTLEMQDALAEAIATRTGTGIGQDMYPRILAGAVIAAAQVAVRWWSAADPPVPLGPLLRRALEQLATACSQPPAGE